MSRLFFWLKLHGYHLIFGVSLVSLVSLLAWWSIFIHGTIQHQKDLFLEILNMRMQYLALGMAQHPRQPVSPGILESDPRFEIVTSRMAVSGSGINLPPPHDGFFIRPRDQVLTEIENRTQRLNFMLFGESALLALIVLVSILFLYRYIRLEKRTTQAVQEFWERSAHQIKTPITGIKIFLQNLKNRAFSSDQLDAYVKMALIQVDIQERLAGNILSGHQLMQDSKDAGDSRLALKEFLTNYFEQALHLSDIDLEIGLEDLNNLFVLGNANGLKVALDNITDNAVKYCTPDVKVQVQISWDAHKVRIAICDNGPGFSESQLPAIFEAYKHLNYELPRKNQGSGIGLYLSRRLMKKMGGDLEAKSAGPGKGACFTIILRRTK